jgi:beta-phosphoglucomutase
MTINPYSAILFDLDGVLVDATEWHFDALNRALLLFGYQISRYQHLAEYNGLPTRVKLDMLSVEKGLPKALHGLIGRLKKTYTHEEILRHCWPSFEKEYMLSRLKREGYRLAVCTNSVGESTELMLERAGLRHYFDFVISNEDVARPKPDPEIYLSALDRLGIPPQKVVIVEDSPHGIESATGSGATVFEVAGFAEVDYWRLRQFIDASVSKETSC